MQMKCKKCLVKVALELYCLMIYATGSGYAARQKLVFRILGFNFVQWEQVADNS